MIARSGENDKLNFEKTGSIFSGTIYVLIGLIILSMLGLPWLVTEYFAPVAEESLKMNVPVITEGWSVYIGPMKLPLVPLLIAFFLLPVTIIAAMFVRFKNVDRAKEYMCGEKVNYTFSSFYFSTEKATPYFYATGVLFFVALIIVALI